MPLLFKAKTSEAYQLKVLAELLKDNLKSGCFEIDDDGISLRQMDNNRKTLIDLELHSENFCPYVYNDSEKRNVGLTLTHFHRMLKTIKKKDSLQLIIDDTDDRQLSIKTIPKENARVTTSFIMIQQMQNVEVDIPTGYGKPTIIGSPEFQKTCKDLLNIGSTIKIQSQGNFGLAFYSDADGVIKRRVEFGDVDDDSGTIDERRHGYCQTFETDQLSRVSKVSGLCQTLQIYCAHGKPLMIRSCVGSLGRITIYIKSIEEIEEESSMEISYSDSDS